jgi:nucleoside-diphosphate-sugar epimerase
MTRAPRILLTGGNGDLGKALSPRLLASGMAVSSLDPSAEAIPDVTQIQGSILDRDLVRNATTNADLIVHIAAWHGFHAFTGSKSSSEFWDLNMTGTFNLLDACVASKTRKLVFISSSSVDEWPEMYGVTKLLGEELCRSYAERDGLQVISLRPRAFIPWWNTAVYKSKEEWAQWFARGAIHIDDVAESVYLSCLKLLQSDQPLFETLALDGKQDFSAKDLERWRVFGAREFLKSKFPYFEALIDSASFIPTEPPTYKDISRARDVLGFDPKYGFHELLSEMANERVRDSRST